MIAAGNIVTSRHHEKYRPIHLVRHGNLLSLFVHLVQSMHTLVCTAITPDSNSCFQGSESNSVGAGIMLLHCLYPYNAQGFGCTRQSLDLECLKLGPRGQVQPRNMSYTPHSSSTAVFLPLQFSVYPNTRSPNSRFSLLCISPSTYLAANMGSGSHLSSGRIPLPSSGSYASLIFLLSTFHPIWAQR